MWPTKAVGAFKDTYSKVTTRWLAFIIIFFVTFVVLQISPKPGSIISMRVVAQSAGIAQWYFDSGHGYSESQSVSIRTHKGPNVLHFNIPAGTYNHLRFDPTKSDTDVTIDHVALGAANTRASGPLTMDNFRAGSGIARLESTKSGLKIIPVPGTDDPQLQIHLQQPLVVQSGTHYLVSNIVLALLASLFLVTATAIVIRHDTTELIIIGVALVVAFVVAMDLINPHMVHPDEALHLSGFEYYLHHFWPPAANDPAIIPSLKSSPWGISYLNSFDVVYFISAHLMSPVVGFFSSPLQAARAFQHILLLVLLLLAARRRVWAMVAGALLLAPGAWYLFVYFNGDAFPMFLSMAAVMLVADRKGGLGKFIERTQAWNVACIAFALLICLLLVSKRNYLPVAMGLIAWLAVRYIAVRWTELAAVFVCAGCVSVAAFVFRIGSSGATRLAWTLCAVAACAGLILIASLALRYTRNPETRPAFHRLLFLIGLALVFAAPRVADDLWLNGGPAAKAATVTTMTEKYARNDLKPSVIASGHGNPDMHWAQKGISLHDMLFNRHWIRTSTLSAFGVYGYMSEWGPLPQYHLSWLVALLLISLAAASIIRRRRGEGAKLVVVACGAFVIVFVASMMYSWVWGFQPQGRYLLPMIPLAGLMFGDAMPFMPRKATRLLLVSAILIGAYSWLAVGMPGIAAL